MVRELSNKVPAFSGVASHTQCFLHTVNLIAKSLIREFNIKKQDADQEIANSGISEDDGLDELSIAEDDSTTSAETCDDESGWVDEVELLADDERDALERDIRPVKLALVKVSPVKKTLTWKLNLYPSCESWHTKSFIQPLLCSLHGVRFSRTCASL